MRGIILYRTYHGSTRQYAEYIAGTTGFPLYDLDSNQLPSLENCDLVVIGTPVYMGYFSVTSWLKEHWEILKDKRIILLSITAFSGDHNSIEKIYQQNFSEEIRKHIKHYHIHGRLSKSGLSRWEQFALNIGNFFSQEADQNKSEQCKLLEEAISYIKSLSLEADYKQ